MRPELPEQLFGAGDRRRLRELLDLDAEAAVADLSEIAPSRLRELEVLVTGWGSPWIGAEELTAMPRLRAIFHAAGTVKEHLASQVWERGILVTTAADANARPVAEYALAMILLAGKGIPTLVDAYARGPAAARGGGADGRSGADHAACAAVDSGGTADRGAGASGGTADRGADASTGAADPADDPADATGLVRPADAISVVHPVEIGNYRQTVGIIGASRIGRRVIELLRPFDFEILLYDPQVTAGDSVLAAVELTGLDDLCSRAGIVSVHAPLLPETVGMVGRRQLEAMRPGSVLINTARAPIVDQDALAARARTGALTAILDVTDPEPLPPDHPLRQIPGVVLTPHVAGALGNEVRRLGESALREVALFRAGAPAEHPVTKEALIAMA